MTNPKPTGKQGKNHPKSVKTVPGIQPLHLIEGDELDKYATEFSDDEIRRADKQARRAMRFPDLLYAAVIKPPDDET